MAVGRMYTVAIGSEGHQSAVATLVEVLSATDSVTLIERAWVKQTSFDTSENSGIKIEDIATSGTGTATTPRPLMEGDTAFGGVVETNATIEPSYSGTVYIEEGFNVLSGFLWTPANDDEAIVVSPGQLVGMALDVGLSTSMDLSYGVTMREIGG